MKKGENFFFLEREGRKVCTMPSLAELTGLYLYREVEVLLIHPVAQISAGEGFRGLFWKPYRRWS